MSCWPLSAAHPELCESVLFHPALSADDGMAALLPPPSSTPTDFILFHLFTCASCRTYCLSPGPRPSLSTLFSTNFSRAIITLILPSRLFERCFSSLEERHYITRLYSRPGRFPAGSHGRPLIDWSLPPAPEGLVAERFWPPSRLEVASHLHRSPRPRMRLWRAFPDVTIHSRAALSVRRYRCRHERLSRCARIERARESLRASGRDVDIDI